MDTKVANWKARNSVWRNSKKYKELSGRTREENRLIKQEEKKRKKLAESNEADAIPMTKIMELNNANSLEKNT